MFRRALLLVVGAWLVAAAPAWGKGDLSDRMIPDGFFPITDADKALTKVSYAEGAPAAVLLNARQCEWFEGEQYILRMSQFRRVKILTEAGVQKEGDFVWRGTGKWRIKDVRARTVLPDGTEVDASGSVFVEKSEGMQQIRVAFPKVQVGAILDLRFNVTADAVNIPAWVIQEDIPVLESRMILIPPGGMKYRAETLGLSAEQTKPESFRSPNGKVIMWNFQNVASLPDEPNLPPRQEISQSLFIVPEQLKLENGSTIPIAQDWKTLSQYRKRSWDDWLKKGDGDAEALAKQVAGAAPSNIEKAEAIRRALRERVRTDFLSDWPEWASPNEVLAKGSGTSADIAATAVAMLRAVNVPAELAAIRRRSEGMIPTEFPLPVLFDDLLVRIATPNGPLFFSPVADMSVGQLPWDCTFLMAMPYDGKAEGLVKIPDSTAAQNRTVRETKATLDRSGMVSGETVETCQGVAAERWRRSLRDKDAAARQERVREHVQRYVRGAQVKSMEIGNLDDDAKDLVIRIQWEGETYAMAAGKRLVVNTNFFSRLSADDWPPAERKNEVEIGSNFEEQDTVTLTLPPNVADVTAPLPASMKAGPVGVYEAAYEKGEGRVTARRHMRLDMHRLPAPAYTSVRRWFSDIAAYDQKPVAVVLK